MRRLLADELFNAQLIRAIGYAPYGGADFGDCVSTAARITKVDVDLWHDQWRATADRVHAQAVASRDAGAAVSGARTQFHQSAFDWLDTTLNPTQRSSTTTVDGR